MGIRTVAIAGQGRHIKPPCKQLGLTPAGGLADWRDDISPRAPWSSPAASAICHSPSFPVLVRDVGGGSNGLRGQVARRPARPLEDKERRGMVGGRPGFSILTSTSLSPFNNGTVFVCRHHPHAIKQDGDVWRRVVGNHAVKQATAAGQNKKTKKGRYMPAHHRSLGLSLALAPGPAPWLLGHFSVSLGGSKTDDPMAASVNPSTPKKEALSSLHIAVVG
ncbi:hypothetical protein B0T18DRAFT_195084 [Schizothecium vesticola]|uniref:Uncharacterized protein n=1 Tax=Schizothecium vesticola TaxID=314040 RepID=A0AA40K302_9PEZI|nr:hypothetical protein B0T18DRAFT_195084 [Schizothecium vesticola]